MFRELTNVLQMEEQPKDFMMDFEVAAINAAAAANFPRIEKKGCFYHLTSNLWKRIQRVGLQGRYDNDAMHTHAIATRFWSTWKITIWFD